MNAVRLFCEIVAQGGKSRAGDYASQPTYRHLLDAGLIQEKGVVQSICCDDCDQSHDSTVVFENGHYGYFCPDLGFLAKDRSELVAVTPNISTFVEKLACDLNCKRRKSTPISGDTWRVGAIESHAGEISVYFHPFLQDASDIHELKSALAKEVSARFGIIITAIGLLTYQNYQTIPLRNGVCFDQSKGQFCIDVDIEAIAGVPQVNTGGRPNEHKVNIEKIMIIRSREGRSFEGRNAEANGVLEEYRKHFPNEIVPSKSSANRYVTQIRRGS